MKVYMTINLVMYMGITLVIAGVILYGVSSFMIKRIQKREREINRYIFEIVRPKPRGKKWLYLIMNIRGFVVVEYANY